MPSSRISSVALIVFHWLIVSACSTPATLPPELLEARDHPDLETVVILGLNDVHGALAPISFQSKETGDTPSVTYEKGGAAILASHIKILRQQFGSKLLILDAGDQFQGTLESNSFEGAPVVRFYNTIGVNAAAIGNHEFDFGPVGPEGAMGDPRGALKARMSEAHYPYLAANIVEKATGKPPAWPNTFGHLILTAGSLKVGVIGLSTLETPTSTRATFVRDLVFQDLRKTTLRHAKLLREQGARLIVVVAHAGLKCEKGRSSGSSLFRSEADAQGECVTESSRDGDVEMTHLLKSLPPGTVDAVVSGHSHQIIHHWVNGVPVIQGGARGHDYNLIYLVYDRSRNKLLTDRTRIEGPISVCPKVFEYQNDCNGQKPAPKAGRGDLITPYFHGEPIYPDPEIETLLAPIFKETEKVRSRIIGHAARPITHTRTEESELGNLVADAMRIRAEADVAIMNPGGIRAPFDAGPITYDALFRAFPFDNSISKLTLTGKELKRVLALSQSGARGYFPVSGVKLKVIHLDHNAPSRDQNGNGRIEPWEFQRLVEARLENGAAIQDQKNYTVALPDFLVTGGDDFEWVMSRIPSSRIQFDTGSLIRDALDDHIGRHSPLNPSARPLVDPAKPRLVKVKSARKSRARTRRVKTRSSSKQRPSREARK